MTDPLKSDRAWALFYRDGLGAVQIAAELGCSVQEIEGLKAPLHHATRTILRMTLQDLERLQEIIAHQANSIENQDKMLSNLTEALDDMTGRKRSVREAERQRAIGVINFGRNPNWRESALLGWREGVFWAPTKLFLALKEPVAMTVLGLMATIGQLVGWIAARPLLLGAGLLGFVRPAKP